MNDSFLCLSGQKPCRNYLKWSISFFKDLYNWLKYSLNIIWPRLTDVHLWYDTWTVIFLCHTNTCCILDLKLLKYVLIFNSKRYIAWQFFISHKWALPLNELKEVFNCSGLQLSINNVRAGPCITMGTKGYIIVILVDKSPAQFNV